VSLNFSLPSASTRNVVDFGLSVEQALYQMSLDNNGNVICPKTKEVFPYKKVEKVYVM